ncbi:MAG: cytochrome c-type biogenesis protein CcmH [Candidatus Palauibacterales bacterium]|nr:cytochrome c-type biogenesis protein CcmH [Candidatus Palauibacterales bacterium]
MSRGAASLLILLLLVGPAPGTAQETPGGTPSAQQTEAPDDTTGRSALTDPREAELDAQAAEVASGLRCPVCRNQSIVESNAELSREMHRLVRDKLAAGETPEQVREYFVSRYGEWILLKPQARGVNLLVYGLPLAVLILGFFLARNRLRKWAGAGGAAEAAGVVELGPDDEEWLREALREG